MLRHGRARITATQAESRAHFQLNGIIVNICASIVNVIETIHNSDGNHNKNHNSNYNFSIQAKSSSFLYIFEGLYLLIH